MQIFSSRFTPGATGDQVSFRVGETVKVKGNDGVVGTAVIDSERMSHDLCDHLGYECLVDGGRYFIDGTKIMWWDGICK